MTVVGNTTTTQLFRMDPSAWTGTPTMHSQRLCRTKALFYTCSEIYPHVHILIRVTGLERHSSRHTQTVLKPTSTPLLGIPTKAGQ